VLSYRAVRRFLFWYLPLGAAVLAAAVFAYGFAAFVRGDTGTPVDLGARAVTSAAPQTRLVPLILGDSLARGTGDESGLGIGGRLVDELRKRQLPVERATNLAVDGARTLDLLRVVERHNVQQVAASANVIVVSIGGNDLWGGTDWRSAPPRDPDAVMDAVLANIETIVKTLRAANPRARIFYVGLYNPFVSTPMGAALNPLVARWNVRVGERFASDPNFVVVQTADLFRFHDRLSADRFHPSAEGYALIARRIADAF
jgi:lysophospholipase L1-like esterase